MSLESDSTRQKLLIIDGHNLLFQMFHGMPSGIIGKEGTPIHAIIGFVGGLLKIKRMTSPSHIVVIFDGETGSDRSQIYPEYKANRIDYSEVPDCDNPYSQLEDIFKALDYMGIKHFLSTEGAEADDVIAAYATQYGEGMEVIISSSDTDFMQLVNDSVSVLAYRGQNTIIYNPDRVLEKWGVKPECYAEYKSLIGDKSDNIKGIPKIGPKTAVQLITDFGSTEAIIANAISIKKPSIQAAIINHSDTINTNLDLIKLNRLVSMPFNLAELTVAHDFDLLSTNSVMISIGIR